MKERLGDVCLSQGVEELRFSGSNPCGRMISVGYTGGIPQQTRAEKHWQEWQEKYLMTHAFGCKCVRKVLRNAVWCFLAAWRAHWNGGFIISDCYFRENVPPDREVSTSLPPIAVVQKMGLITPSCQFVSSSYHPIRIDNKRVVFIAWLSRQWPKNLENGYHW